MQGGTGNTVMNQTDKYPSPHGFLFQIPMGECHNNFKKEAKPVCHSAIKESESGRWIRAC